MNHCSQIQRTLHWPQSRVDPAVIAIGFATLFWAGGRRAACSVRTEDLVFRIGGDEFLVLAVGADRAEGEQILDRLRQRWAELGEPVGFSAGIAVGERELMRLADEHMYADKRSRDLSAD